MSSREDTPISVQMGESIVIRLVQVEREQKALRRTNTILTIGLVATVALLIVGFATVLLSVGRRTLDTQQVVLRDSRGLVRGTFGVEQDSVSLTLYDHQSGRARLVLAVPANGSPTVSMADARGRSRVALSLYPNEQATLAFSDAEGLSRAVFALQPSNAAYLVFVDDAGDPRAVLGIEESGIPTWSFVEDPETAGASAPDGR